MTRMNPLVSFCTVLVCLATAPLVASAPTQRQFRQASTDVPDFVSKYGQSAPSSFNSSSLLTFTAPILYFHSEETHFPTDLTTFLTHTTPQIDYTAVPNAPDQLTLSNLNQLGEDVYLTSKDDPTTDPDWLKGIAPDSNGATSGINSAIIINSKNNSSIDVFYFYFYAFNPGTNVLGLPFLNFGASSPFPPPHPLPSQSTKCTYIVISGNHVGDWEHTMLRFPSATSPPEAMWYSQHANGQAFRYAAVEKDGNGIRPVVYVAKGSHANYAITGTHSHVIPNLNLPAGALEDYTDKGVRWDAVGSSWVYNYNSETGGFEAYGDAPLEWLEYKGKWGDEAYPNSDERQVDLFGQKKWVGGPTGPVDKQLDRKEVCPDNGILCILRSILVPRTIAEEKRTEHRSV